MRVNAGAMDGMAAYYMMRGALLTPLHEPLPKHRCCIPSPTSRAETVSLERQKKVDGPSGPYGILLVTVRFMPVRPSRTVLAKLGIYGAQRLRA